MARSIITLLLNLFKVECHNLHEALVVIFVDNAGPSAVGIRIEIQLRVRIAWSMHTPKKKPKNRDTDERHICLGVDPGGVFSRSFWRTVKAQDPDSSCRFALGISQMFHDLIAENGCSATTMCLIGLLGTIRTICTRRAIGSLRKDASRSGWLLPAILIPVSSIFKARMSLVVLLAKLMISLIMGTMTQDPQKKTVFNCRRLCRMLQITRIIVLYHHR